MKIVPKEVSSQDDIAAMIKMCFTEPFWKEFNAVVGSIGQLIQGGLLDQNVIDDYNSQKKSRLCHQNSKQSQYHI